MAIVPDPAIILLLLFAGAAGGADNWAGVAGAGAGLAAGLAAGISATGAGAGEEGEGEGGGGELEYVAACAGGGGDGMLLAGGGMGIEVVVGGDPAAGAVPFCWMASWVNWAWDLSAVGLMLKVMPLPQWEVGVFCLQ